MSQLLYVFPLQVSGKAKIVHVPSHSEKPAAVQAVYRKLLIKVLLLNGLKCTSHLNMAITPQLPVRSASNGKYCPKQQYQYLLMTGEGRLEYHLKYIEQSCFNYFTECSDPIEVILQPWHGMIVFRLWLYGIGLLHAEKLAEAVLGMCFELHSQFPLL